MKEKLKLIIAGSDKIYAIENFYTKHLRNLGVEVHHFTGQTRFLDFYQKSIFNKLLFKSGLSGVYRKINKELLTLVEKEMPVAVVVFKGMEIYPETLQAIKTKGIKILNYNPDNPFIFSGKGSGNKNVSNAIPFFDLYLSYDSGVVERMRSERNIKAEILPFGFEVSEEVFEKCTAEEEVMSVCFMGNPDTDRINFINSLAEKGISIHVYGHDWQGVLKGPNIQFCGHVYQDDAWKTLRKYRVQLNLMRIHNPTSHNMRTFEIGGIGGIQLAPATTDHQTYFQPGKEIFLYNNVDDCASQAEYLLSLSKEVADEIRINARTRSLQSGYTYKSRSEELLRWIRSVL